MKRTITLLSFLFLAMTSTFAITNANWQMKINSIEEFSPVSAELPSMDMEAFLDLTPREYKEITGKKLTLKERLKLKAAQKFIKKRTRKAKKDSGITSGLYILLAIFGLAWVAMAIMDDFEGSNWIVNIILTALFWLPGLIHALIKKKEYF